MVRYIKNKLIFLFLGLPVLLFLFVQYNAFGKDSEVISREEVKQVLQALDPGIKVLAVDQAPIEGLWEVIVESRGRKSIVYLDYTRTYILSGSVIDISSRTDLTKKKFDEINKVDVSAIDLGDALVMGDPRAKHKVIVFDDPD